MKQLLVSFLLLFVLQAALSQVPQFALVKPNGTTFIYSTFDSANASADDNDYIYLPGTVITGDKTISKNITLIGTGIYPDSTQFTGKTIFNGHLTLTSKCNLEGFEISNNLNLSDSNSSGSIISRMQIHTIYLGGSDNNFIDGSAIYLISGKQNGNNNCSKSSNNLIKNSILNNIVNITDSKITNCLFEGHNQYWTYFKTANCSFSNCIFSGIFSIDWNFENPCFQLIANSSNNCIFFQTEYIPGLNNFSTNRIDTIMVNPGISLGYAFGYSYNYHLAPNSSFKNSGDDGTEIGIYGGSSPFKEGAVPRNPHIYFKHVETQTDGTGQLQIQFKVRTGN